MKQQLTQDRIFFVHDFDGVHIATDMFNDAYGDIYKFYGQAKIAAARELLASTSLNDEKIVALGKKSYHETGDGLHFFRAIAEERGLDKDAFYRDVHKRFHEISYDQAISTHAEKIIPCESTISSFDRLQGRVKHGLLTMSCAESWAKPFLTKLKLIDYFEPNARLGAAEVNFENKADSTYPLASALNRLGAHAAQSVFIEDSLKNLAMAKQLDEEILTVFVSETAATDSIPDFVDIHVRNVSEFLETTANMHAPRISPEITSAQSWQPPKYGFGS